MTFLYAGRLSSSAGALLLVACLAGSGCATSEDTSMALAQPSPIYAGRGPVDTGAYPNLNIGRQAATTQFTPEETQARLAALDAARVRQSPVVGGGETPEARKRRLKLLADEQDEALRVIESN